MKSWKYLPNKEKQRIKDLLEKIRFETCGEFKNYINDGDVKKIKRGTFLCTAGQMGNFGHGKNILKYIGYTCQIRIGRNKWEEEVFLRHLDGSLTPHSEQTFFRLSKKNTKRLNKLFSKMMIKEKKQTWDKNLCYRSIEGVEKTGYLIN